MEGKIQVSSITRRRCIINLHAYVDLNPIRAKIAASVETSEYISAYERLLPCKIDGVAQQQEKPLEYAFTKKLLFGFVGDENQLKVFHFHY